MRVLVGCEFSATVRDAFRARGHDAWSCDLRPTTGDPCWHWQADVLDVLDLLGGFDLAIFHPPCTDLAASGARWWPMKQAEQAASLAFVRRLMDCDVPRWALENPVGLIGTAIRPADQIVNPWQFGDPFNKKTCLWLKGLPPLRPTNVVTPTANWINGSARGGGRKPSALAAAPSHRSEKVRSQFFPGFAQAMADQWGAAA